MNKEELKNALREQYEPLNEAVNRKLTEFVHDCDLTEDFADENDDMENAEDDNFDSSLSSAFQNNNEPYSAPDYQDHNINELVDNYGHPSPEPQYIGERPTQQSISEHRDNMSARIAFLRGISLPGDYLQKKQ